LRDQNTNTASLDHTSNTLKVSSLTEVTLAIADLFETSVPVQVPGEHGIGVTRLPWPDWIYHFGIPLEDVTFTQVYDRLISSQLNPLEEAILPRQRVAKERTARLIAAEFMLASAVIQIIVAKEESEEEGNTPQTTGGADFMPSRTTDDVKDPQTTLGSSQGLPGYRLSSQFDGAVFSLPFHSVSSRKGKERVAEYLNEPFSLLDTFPTPSYTPSQASISHASFAPGHSETSTRAVVGRLNRLCQIRKHPSGRNPRPTTLLTHWTIGQDPEVYNWRETIFAIEKAQEEAVMTPSERQREWRKRQKKERQKRKEEEKWRKLQAVTSSQPVVLDSRVLEEEERVRRRQSRGRSRSMGRSVSRGVSLSVVDEGFVQTGEAQRRTKSSGVAVGVIQSSDVRGSKQETIARPAKKRKKRTSGF
jgi:hypothetical protein